MKQISEIELRYLDGFRPDVLIYLDNFPLKRSNLETAMLYLIDMMVEFPIFVFAYFNVKNINFKTYLADIMSGYQIK